MGNEPKARFYYSEAGLPLIATTSGYIISVEIADNNQFLKENLSNPSFIKDKIERYSELLVTILNGNQRFVDTPDELGIEKLGPNIISIIGHEKIIISVHIGGGTPADEVNWEVYYTKRLYNVLIQQEQPPFFGEKVIS
jgi:hypothetical protein